MKRGERKKGKAWRISGRKKRSVMERKGEACAAKREKHRYGKTC